MKDPIETFHYRYSFDTSEPLTNVKFKVLENFILFDLWDEGEENDVPWIISDLEQTQIKENEK
mgnify:FL=1